MTVPILHLGTPLRIATFNVGCGITRKLFNILTRCIDLTIDIIALQEIGDPVVPPSSHPSHSIIIAHGPSNHQAGVGLLISRALTPRCRSYHRSDTGRLVGAVIEISRGRRLLVVSAYMPTGLDHANADTTTLAEKVYDELMGWTIGMHQVIVMGDLNETMTRFDRLPLPLPSALPWSSHSSRPIHRLRDAGYIDEYRRAHHDPISSPGFTHVIDTAAAHNRSRIDYIWTFGVNAASVRRIRIDGTLFAASHHHLLWMELSLSQPVVDHTPLTTLRIPNLTATSEKQKEKFVSMVERTIGYHYDDMIKYAQSGDVNSIDNVAMAITTMVRDSAFATLPITGSMTRRNRTMLMLRQQERDIMNLLRSTQRIIDRHDNPILCPTWVRMRRTCAEMHQLRWQTDLGDEHGFVAWMDETRTMIRTLRNDMRYESHRMKQSATDKFEANPAAAIHRMMQSDDLPSTLYSVINNDGDLTSSADELKDVMVDHFTTVFAVPPLAVLVPSPAAPPDMLFNKPDIDARWYDPLMIDVSIDEVLMVVSDAPMVSAPGRDEVSIGVWRIVITGSEYVREIIAALFSSCMSTSTFPTAWKHSVIIPLVKDAKKEMTMKNIRPISLQSCLGKLFNNIMARRLSSIFAHHNIINTAQRGFVSGGTTIKCIDELHDAWDWSRKHGAEQYTLLYDITQAYDSVQIDKMLRAMRRIHVPERFVLLIGDSLTGLSSCVRTVYGHTQSFDVDRSLRQGDPLAPLLFVILIDALHDGLDVNPFTGEQHGCRITTAGGNVSTISSLGYADDTGVITNSLASLLVQNEWVHYFMQFNALRLNPSKRELVGRDSDGDPVTTAAIANAGVRIHGEAIVPRPHDAPIRYLGVHSCFNGDWKPQQAKSLSTIVSYCRIATKFELSISRAVYLFNVFLMPKIELALHYVHGPGTKSWIDKCDRLIIGAIKHISSSCMRLTRTGVAMTIGLTLPSWIETSVKVSELFYRMNSTDERWGGLGRMMMRRDKLTSVDSTTPLHVLDTPSYLARATDLAVRSLRWNVLLSENHVVGCRHPRLMNMITMEGRPLLNTTTKPIILSGDGGHHGGAEIVTHTAHDVWSGWGTKCDQRDVNVYTDGSFDRADMTSSWSAVVWDDWFDMYYMGIPTDEHDIRADDLRGANMHGASITATVGVYPAELQAIIRALTMMPMSYKINIYSDSRSSIEAISEYQQQVNERKRMRMSARPLLELIRHFTNVRRASGGSVTYTHVKAHTTDADCHSVGNRMADYQANIARSHPTRTYPLSIAQLPVDDCEQYLRFTDSVTGRVMINDPRRTAMSLMQANAIIKWKQKREQGKFACDGVIDLGAAVMKNGTPAQQTTVVHIATNTIQYYLHYKDGRAKRADMRQVQCGYNCHQHVTLAHLIECGEASCLQYRDDLRDAIVAVFDPHSCARDWLRLHRHHDLNALLLVMFTPSPSIVALGGTDEHATLMSIGAFTSAESNAAARRIGFDRDDVGREVMVKVRLSCVDHIAAAYNKMKGIT